MQNTDNLFESQRQAVENGSVFSRVQICKCQGDGSVSKEMSEGVVFVAGNTRLMTKDGDNNILTAIGLENFDGKVDKGSCKFFRPTTFDELIVAFRYTEAKALESYFRSAEFNNSNLNSLICCFLKQNLDETSVDVKELASTSLQIKEIVDEKSQTYYDEKVDFYAKKIEKYQSKIQSLRDEQSGKNELGEEVVESECHIADAMQNYVEGVQATVNNQPMQVDIEHVLDYFNAVKTFNTVATNEQSNVLAQSTSACETQENA